MREVKKLMKMAAVLSVSALLSGCVNNIGVEDDDQKFIVFHTTLGVEQTPMRVKPKGISKLIVSDYFGRDEQQRIEQAEPDESFGQVPIQLRYGMHELLFVGHNSDVADLKYTEAKFDKVMDTFSFYTSIEVDEGTAPVQNVSLNRATALLKIVATDAIPATVAALKVSVTNYHPVLNVGTAESAGKVEPLERTFEYKLSHVGMKGSTYSIYTFSPVGGFTTNVVITSVDADGGTLHSIRMKDVPIEKNRQTILSGDIFHLNAGVEISVDTQWNEPIEIPIG